MKLLALRFCLMLAAALPGLGPGTFAQGLLPTPDADYRNLGRYAPQRVQETVVSEVGGQTTYQARIVDGPLPDLPGRMTLTDIAPRPGRQHFSDCTAWAVAYCSLTAQNADARGREGGNAAVDIFSPRFVYSQINQGQDSGSFIYNGDASVPSAIDLLFSDGCATEATCPYISTGANPPGWSVGPTQRGLTEGRHHDIVQHQVCESIDDIRYSLVFGVPVVIAAYTEPAFYSHSGGAAYRWQGGRDGRHAMCIVGYDNVRQEFLIQNSWGTTWGDAGRCWVPYDHFHKLSAPNRLDGWCYEAHAIIATGHNQTQHRFTVDPKGSYFFLPDGSLTDANSGNEMKPEGTFEDVVATDHYIYGLKSNGTIEGYVQGQGWYDITSGQWDKGFSGGSGRMIAASRKALFAITELGSVVVRLPRQHSHSNVAHWHRINLPDSEAPVDLRIRGDTPHVSTADGDVFQWNAANDPSQGQWIKLN